MVALQTVRVKPIRAVLAGVIGLTFMFFIMYIWYVTQPVALKVIAETQALTETLGHNNTYVNTGITILTWIEYWWGPLCVIAFGVMWMYVSAHREEWESKYE
jgi:hypothetical protein